MSVVILIAALAAAGFAAAAWWEARRARQPEGLAGKAVLVSTIGTTSIRGVVHADLPDRLTIREAVVLSVGSDATAPAGGLIHIDRLRIDVVQELPAPAAPTEG